MFFTCDSIALALLSDHGFFEIAGSSPAPPSQSSQAHGVSEVVPRANGADTQQQENESSDGEEHSRAPEAAAREGRNFVLFRPLARRRPDYQATGAARLDVHDE